MEINVYDDCLQLLESFSSAASKANCAHFELFCRCWLDMQFQHIYSAQTNHIEILQTTLAALHVGKRVACGRRINGEPFNCTRTQRIGAFYLLYAIYNKQPTQHFIKIEVAPDTWNSLTAYVEALRCERGAERDTQQVSYIFWKLVQQSAFRFSALDYPLALDGLAHYDKLLHNLECTKRPQAATTAKQQLRYVGANLREEMSSVRELHDVCKPLCELEAEYNRQKEQLAVSQPTALPATSIFSQLQEVFDDISGLLGNNVQQPETRTTEQPTTSSMADTKHISTRQRIKQKAMYGEESKRETTEKKVPVEQVERRMSSFTVFGKQLPDEVARDLEYVHTDPASHEESSD